MTAPPRPYKSPEHTMDAYERRMWAYIEHLEAENRNLRESCEVLKGLEQQANTRIAELEVENWERMDRIAELEDVIEARDDQICYLGGHI